MHILSLSQKGGFSFPEGELKIEVSYLKSRFLVFLGKVEVLSTNAHIPYGDWSGDPATASFGWNVGSSVHPSSPVSVTCMASVGFSVFDSQSVRFWAWRLEMLSNSESFMTLSYYLFEKEKVSVSIRRPDLKRPVKSHSHPHSKSHEFMGSKSPKKGTLAHGHTLIWWHQDHPQRVTPTQKSHNNH